MFGQQFSDSVQDALGDHEVLRYRADDARGSWESSKLPPGQKLEKPSPLFRKLDEGIVAEERSRLG